MRNRKTAQTKSRAGFFIVLILGGVFLFLILQNFYSISDFKRSKNHKNFKQNLIDDDEKFYHQEKNKINIVRNQKIKLKKHKKSSDRKNNEDVSYTNKDRKYLDVIIDKNL